MSDTVQLSDQFLLSSSLKSDPEVRVSKGLNVARIPDGNMGSYGGGLITIDATSALNGSKGFGSLRDSYLTVPFVITARNTSLTNVALAGALNRYVVGLKANVSNVIDSLELTLNGKSILTHSEYKGYWNNLRAMTEYSLNEVKKHGAETYAYPDNWASIGFANVSSAGGDGFYNNPIEIANPLDINTLGNRPSMSYNDGFQQRLLANPMPVIADQSTFGWATLNGSNGASRIIAAQSARGAFIPAFNGTFTAQTGVNQNANAGTWIYMLKIRLTDLHPIFKDLDLIANPQLCLRFRVNQGVVAISGTANAMKLDSSTFESGSTCPIMIAACTTNQPMSGVLSADRRLSFAYGVLRNQFSQSGVDNINQFIPYTTTMLHIPFYELSDPRPIINKPVKTIRYLDCVSQYFKGRAGEGVDNKQINTSFQLQLSATKKNIKYVALIPFSETSSGHWATANNTEQFQSPFDSAPNTFQPGSYIRNFQVILGSQNVFTKTHEYDYETFAQEFSKLSALEGDMTRDVVCGLVDSDQWSHAQRVMIADCSRLSSKDVPASIVVSGTNACTQGTNLLVLVIHERELDINRLTGEVERWD